ncbi:MAG: T9SS type A sorting domain-containing protein [Bacteroidetes bacterium]|nr:T9SS type A sorting domain-containing protein [Bacteroidota bacterium]
MMRCLPNGNLEPILSYDSPSGQWDYGYDVAIDNAGNVIMASSALIADDRRELTITKHSPTGELLWDASFSSVDSSHGSLYRIGLDSAGNVFLAAIDVTRLILLKYSNAGELIDSISFGDDSTIYDVGDVLVAPDGSCYVSASGSDRTDGGFTYLEKCLIVKVDGACNVLWTQYLNSFGWATLRLDRTGNLVVGMRMCHVIAKYTSDGQLQWINRHPFETPIVFVGSGLEIDSQNRIVFAGYTYDNPTLYDYAVAWVDPDGNRIRSRTFNTPGNLPDECQAIALDRDDNVYLTGYTGDGPYEHECLTVKFDPAGNPVWDVTFSIDPSTARRGWQIAIDDSGSVYIGGTYKSTAEEGYLVIKYRQEAATDVDPFDYLRPAQYTLSQNYPNPFNPRTTFRYALASPGFVSLKVYGVLGNEVARLVQGHQDAGTHNVEFDASDLPSGIYFYRLQSGAFVDMKKCALVK